jgi:murein DD-endopeptidase MepM/ murein hydrolase activator NlpD
VGGSATDPRCRLEESRRRWKITTLEHSGSLIMKFLVALIGIGLLLLGTSPVDADVERKEQNDGRELIIDADNSPSSRQRGIQPSGLLPVFPKNAACTPIASPYASAARYDGSQRPRTRFGGLHGGIDLTLNEATPLLAIATSKVIASGIGGQAEGIYIWLQHAPKDTGLPFWVYSKYQHLLELPRHAIGDFLKIGDIVGLSGKTGTVGGHYGYQGYAHLHLTTFTGSSSRYEKEGTRIVAEGARMIDPIAIFAQGLTKTEDIEQLPDSRKQVAISYISKDGSIQPPDSRTVWPVACK